MRKQLSIRHLPNTNRYGCCSLCVISPDSPDLIISAFLRNILKTSLLHHGCWECKRHRRVAGTRLLVPGLSDPARTPLPALVLCRAQCAAPALPRGGTKEGVAFRGEFQNLRTSQPQIGEQRPPVGMISQPRQGARLARGQTSHAVESGQPGRKTLVGRYCFSAC